MKKKILVTGADGFIGSHLTEKLLTLGYDVRAFALYNSYSSWGWLDEIPKQSKEGLDVFLGDIRDPNGVRAAVKGCDEILHLASLIAIPYSYHSPDTYVDTNIKGTLNILQAARDSDIPVIHTSTSEVYGSAIYSPIDEKHPLQGQSPYSASKIAADQMAAAFYKSFDLPVTIVRPFNTYGPRQSARAVIPTIITQIISGNLNLSLGATNTYRDFSYIDDTVNGFVAALSNKSAIGSVINLGSGFDISIADTAKLIAKLMGVKITIHIDESRIRPPLSEVMKLCADNSRARSLLNWSPQYADEEGLIAGLEKTIAWFSIEKNIKKYKSEIYNI